MEKSKATLLLLIDLVRFIETRNTFELDELDVSRAFNTFGLDLRSCKGSLKCIIFH